MAIFKLIEILSTNYIVCGTMIALDRLDAEQQADMAKLVLLSAIFIIYELIYFKFPFNKNKLLLEIGFVGVMACALGPRDLLLWMVLGVAELYFMCAYILGLKKDYEIKREAQKQEPSQRASAVEVPTTAPPVQLPTTMPVAHTASHPEPDRDLLVLQRQEGVYTSSSRRL